MRLAIVLVLVLLGAAAARSDELIRFRTADGLVGLVDHPDKVPAGAEIVERRPLRAPKPALPEERAPLPLPSAAAAPPAAPADPEPAPGAELCARFGLGRGCAAEELDTARQWCERSRPARQAIGDAEQALEREEERYEDCRSVQGFFPTPRCSQADLERAEAVLAQAQSAEETLEEDCRTAGCLPGWIREGCQAF
jgi:hypothetical protein